MKIPRPTIAAGAVDALIEAIARANKQKFFDSELAEIIQKYENRKPTKNETTWFASEIDRAVSRLKKRANTLDGRNRS